MSSLPAGLMYGLSWESLFIGIVILAAAVALVAIACRRFGITIPPWVVEVFWVVVVCFVIVAAIRFVFSL